MFLARTPFLTDFETENLHRANTSSMHDADPESTDLKSMMLEPIQFRFLDLPKELRFMVYENLAISTKHLRLLPRENGFSVEPQRVEAFEIEPAITITLHTLPVQIFSTCRLVYSEALPFLTRKLDRIREIIPWITVDADCLYTNAFDNTQTLLAALLTSLDQHPFFTAKPHLTSRQASPNPTYPSPITHWLTQTTHLLLSQRPTLCPLSGFTGARIYPTVRLVLSVPKVWRYAAYRGLAVETVSSTPPLYTGSVTSQLSRLYSGLAEGLGRLEHVKCGAIVFGEEERALDEGGLTVRKNVALDFGICRVGE